MVGWVGWSDGFVGWLDCWPVGRMGGLVGWLVGWSDGWVCVLLAWLVGWMGWLLRWSVGVMGGLVGWVGWLVGRMGWLVAWIGWLVGRCGEAFIHRVVVRFDGTGPGRPAPRTGVRTPVRAPGGPYCVLQCGPRAARSAYCSEGPGRPVLRTAVRAPGGPYCVLQYGPRAARTAYCAVRAPGAAAPAGRLSRPGCPHAVACSDHGNQKHGLCCLMDKALVFGTKDCRLESCQSHAQHADAALPMCACVRRLLVCVRHASVSICAPHAHQST